MRGWLMGAALAGAAVGAGCAGAGVFACLTDASCDGGVCQPEGYCSFPDLACDSGQRFGDHAGDGLAGTCVDAPASTGEVEVASTSSASEATTTGPVATDTGAAVDDTGSTGPGCPDWWDCVWSVRVPITVAWTGPVVEGFIVRVALGPERFDLSQSTTDGADLRFVDDRGLVLPHEVELWDPAAGVAEVWVRIPQLQRGARLWLYAGNPDAPDLQDAAAVWGPDFVAVWHLSPTLANSAGGDPATDESTLDTEGRIGRAREFDGVASLLRPDPALDLLPLFSSEATITAWILPTAWGQGNYGRILDQSSVNTSADGWSFSVAGVAKGMTEPETLRFGFGYDGSGASWRSPASVVLGQWQHVAVSYEGGDISIAPQLYVDGVTGDPPVVAAPVGVPNQVTAVPAAIGALGDGTLRFFAGKIDELRVSVGARSPEWIEAEHADGLDALLIYGVLESAP